MSIENGNGKVIFSRQITLGTLIQLVVIVGTAVGFWKALEGRLDLFEYKLLENAQEISEIKADLKDVQQHQQFPWPSKKQ